MKRLVVMVVLLASLLTLAAYSQSARITAAGAPRETAAVIIRAIPTPDPTKTIVIPGYGIHQDDGTQKEYVVPGYGNYGGSP